VAVLALGMLAVSGCENGLTDINANPNAPENVPVNNLLLAGIWDVAQNSPERGYFGKWVQLYHAENWAQHIAQPVYNDEDKYNPRAGIPDLIFDEMYTTLTDLKEVQRIATESGDDNIWAIAEVMTVYGFAMLVDLYDAIPYAEALNLSGGVTFPAYDDPADIYPDLIARLAAAAGMFSSTAFIGFEDFDPVYHGDVDGWEMFANSLRLRLAMRMVNRVPGAAQTAFEAAWASTIFGSVADQATMDWDAVQPAANPVYEGIVYAGRTGDFRMSESIIDRLAAFNDPRLPIIAEPALSDGQFRGLRNGLLPSEYAPQRVTSDFSTIGEYFLTSDTPSNLLSYAEVLFLGAEAAELGWNVGGATANQLYQDGITAAMTELGIGAGDIATYLGQASVGYTTGTYRGLDAIHVQKWISLFLQGPEAFSDLRRVGWDWTTNAGTTGADLVVAENSATAGEFPARLPSPEKETLLNGNAPTPSVITDKVWWAQ
jgi:hypothetical protein